LPLDKEIAAYECHLDFSDAEKPVSYPVGALKKCMDLYERYQSPDGLAAENQRLWKIGFVVDTLIAEAFSTDFLEVIHGDDYEQSPDDEEGEEWQEHGIGLNIKCPDCGAEAKVIHLSDKGKFGNYACEVCGRHFTL
jgi:ribosomal protein S27E